MNTEAGRPPMSKKLGVPDRNRATNCPLPSGKVEEGTRLRIVYFVNDLNDPAAAKRVVMLQAAGLDIVSSTNRDRADQHYRCPSPSEQSRGRRTLKRAVL